MFGRHGLIIETDAKTGQSSEDQFDFIKIKLPQDMGMTDVI